MSLLSPESLSLFVSPGELVAVRRQGWRGAIAEKRVWPVTVRPENTWEDAAQAFGECLRAYPNCHKVGVVLSNHFVQYQLLPWRDDLGDREEERALAQLSFTQTFGEAASRWHVAVSDEAPGMSRISAAVNADLLAALHKYAAGAARRIVSVQPYLTAAINAFADLFGKDRSAWFVLHEEGRLCLALVAGGQWRWIRCVRVAADWEARLPELLDNEALLAGVEASPGQAMVFAPTTQALAVPGGSRWSWRALRLAELVNFSPSSEGRFAPAIVG